jgi:hypothetical protein
MRGMSLLQKNTCTGRSRRNNLPVGHFEWQHPARFYRGAV